MFSKRLFFHARDAHICDVLPIAAVTRDYAASVSSASWHAACAKREQHDAYELRAAMVAVAVAPTTCVIAAPLLNCIGRHAPTPYCCAMSAICHADGAFD